MLYNVASADLSKLLFFFFFPPLLPPLFSIRPENISEQRILFEARRKGLEKRERERERENKRIRKRGNKFFGAATTTSGRFPILFPPRNYSTYHEIIKVVDRSSIAQVARTGEPSFSPVLGQKIRRVLPEKPTAQAPFSPTPLDPQLFKNSKTRRGLHKNCSHRDCRGFR